MPTHTPLISVFAMAAAYDPRIPKHLLLSREKRAELLAWMTAQEAKLQERALLTRPQLLSMSSSDLPLGYAYTSTPTKLFDILRVRHMETQEELDLTEYDPW